MYQDWQAALKFAWRPNNDGQGDHSDPHDTGGETNEGVTEASWNVALEQGLVSGTLAEASLTDLALVLRDNFWHPIQGDSLPAGVDLVVFDMGMMSGPGRSAKILQTALGFVGEDVDGDIGPKTLTAAQGADPLALVKKLTTSDEAFFGSLHAFTYFGRGWDRRAEDAQVAALALLAPSQGKA